MDPLKEIDELKVKRAELEQALAVNGISEAREIAIRNQVAAYTQEILMWGGMLQGSRQPQQQPTAQAALTRNNWREAHTALQRLVSKMTVHVLGRTSGCQSSGCIINKNGRVLSTKHQLFDVNDRHMSENYEMKMMGDQGELRRVSYRIDHIYPDSDAALFMPVDVMQDCICFEHLHVPLHNDVTFVGARLSDPHGERPSGMPAYTFLLSEGVLNYINTNEAFTTARAHEGWSGAPVFHFHDGPHPTLVGLVRRGHGPRDTFTLIALLPWDLLTSGGPQHGNIYALRTYPPRLAALAATSAASVDTRQEAAAGSSSSARSQDGSTKPGRASTSDNSSAAPPTTATTSTSTNASDRTADRDDEGDSASTGMIVDDAYGRGKSPSPLSGGAL